jgi:hypothetical protein
MCVTIPLLTPECHYLGVTIDGVWIDGYIY